MVLEILEINIITKPHNSYDKVNDILLVKNH